MAALTGITLVKRFPYRGDTLEEFSNTYHFKNAPPGDDASWKVLSDDLINLERNCFTSVVVYTHAYGYNDDAPNAHSVWDHDYSIEASPPAGSFPGGAERAPGDAAGVISFLTNKKNSRGKSIYLRKYMHDVLMDPTDHDKVLPELGTAYFNFAQALDPGGGAFHGGIRARAGDYGVKGVGFIPWITTRTLKRRGKRPLARA